MYGVLKIAALLLCLALAKASPKHSQLSGQRNLMTFMMQNRDVSNKFPERSLECFSYYVPILNEIADEYERSYAACLSFAEQQKADVDKNVIAQRKELDSLSQDACHRLTDCSIIKPAEPYFECYISAGADNEKTMYNISKSAFDAKVELLEQYRLIDSDKDRCTNASDRAYVENTATTYEELQDCLAGKTTVPEKPAETTAKPTDPTNAPIEPTMTPGVLSEIPTEIPIESYVAAEHAEDKYFADTNRKFSRPIMVHN